MPEFYQFAAAYFRAFYYFIEAFGFYELRNGYTLYGSVFGQGNHRVAVAAQKERLYIHRRATDFGSQECAVACRVKYAGHTHDPVGRNACSQECAVSHHVQRIGNDDYLGVWRVFHHLFRYRFYDSGVDADEVVTAHARFAGYA